MPVKAPLYKAPQRPAPPNLTFWTQGFGSWGHTGSDGNAAALSSTYGGFFVGLDALFANDVRAGIVGGYVRSDLDVDARLSSAGIDSGQFGAYAGWRVGGFNLRGGASYTFDNIDVSRTILFPGFIDRTSAHLNGNVGQAFGEIGYGMAFGNVAVEPLAGLTYVHIHDGSFVESGGVAALAGASANEDIGYSTLGARVATILPLANGTLLVPHLLAQWQHAFNDIVPVEALAFQSGGAAFTVAGVPIARDAAYVEAGLNWFVTPQIRFDVTYQGKFALDSSDTKNQTVKGNFIWNF